MKDEDAAARRRNHWVHHIARHAHQKPDAAYLRFEGRSTTWSQREQRVTAVAAPLVLTGGTTVLRPSGNFSSAATLELMAADVYWAEVENARAAHPAGAAQRQRQGDEDRPARPVREPARARLTTA